MEPEKLSIEGKRTKLRDGDKVSIFPLVAGG